MEVRQVERKIYVVVDAWIGLVGVYVLITSMLHGRWFDDRFMLGWMMLSWAVLIFRYDRLKREFETFKEQVRREF